MLREIIFHKSPVPLLKEGLEAFADRHRAIASAIANSEVPGYRQRGIEFESILKKALGVMSILPDLMPGIFLKRLILKR